MPYETITGRRPTWDNPGTIERLVYDYSAGTATTNAVNPTYYPLEDFLAEAKLYTDAQCTATQGKLDYELSTLKERVYELERALEIKADITDLIAWIDTLEDKISKLDKLVDWQTLMLSDEGDENWQ